MTGADIIKRAMSQTTQWVYFQISTEWYALPVENVLELAIISEIVKVPNMPEHILGVIKLREKTLPIVDLRLKLGLKSLKEEHACIAKTLLDRKADHIEWLTALHKSVTEGVPFTKATDPSKCAFGRWYAEYKTPDILITSYLAKFDTPHKNIHKLAKDVLEMRDRGETDKAIIKIKHAEATELKLLIKLFDTTSKLIMNQSNNVSIITKLKDGICVFLVDRLESVIAFNKEEVSPKPELIHGAAGSSMVVGIARTKQFKDKLFLLIDPDKWFDADDLSAVEENSSEKLSAEYAMNHSK